MSKTQKQLLIDINNISCSLSEENAKKIEKVAISLLDMTLLEIMPKLELSELEELDTTEKLMLLHEYSLTKEERQKEETISLEEALKETGLTVDDLQD